jgi:hypothetical protein
MRPCVAPLASRKPARWLKRTLLFATFASLTAVAPAAPSSQSPAIGPVAYHLGPEVRLRKIHLVRPDLISYPLCYEIYC